ncbi:MAG: hypothetical protein QGI41_09785, partial [Acidimicrobiales bacterium]|nr:hypothetical protein [Acidimicrobiales bacterium]
MNLLKWAEKYEGEDIDDELLKKAVAGTAMYSELLHNVNSSLWGFISNCVSAEAETIFKTANTLQGVDAWRRLVRYIEHGKEIRLETLRREVKLLHTKPITSLDKVEEGVAEWENTMNDYMAAGGTEYRYSERKSDLLAVLPAEIREPLLWHSTNERCTFEEFRDHVIVQTSRILMNRKKFHINAVERSDDDAPEDDELNFDNVQSVDDLIMAVQRWQRSGRPKTGAPRRPAPGQRSSPQGPRGTSQGPRAATTTGTAGRTLPRKCPNCGEAHPGRCTKPNVAPEDRLCWSCGKKGHSARDCRQRQPPGRSIKNVEEADDTLTAFFAVDEEGFQRVGRPGRTPRPMPAERNLGHFIHDNQWEHLAPCTWRTMRSTRKSGPKSSGEKRPTSPEVITSVDAAATATSASSRPTGAATSTISPTTTSTIGQEAPKSPKGKLSTPLAVVSATMESVTATSRPRSQGMGPQG